jgi:hypothetical protein
MQGSFDHPPIVIRSSRWKAGILTLVCLAFTIACAAMLMTEIPKGATFGDLWKAWLGVVFFGIGIVVALSALIWPGSLTLTPDGVQCRINIGPGLSRSFGYAWKDIVEIRLWKPARGGKQVAVVLTDEYPRSRTLKLNRQLFNIDNSFAGSWELSPPALCDLMTQAWTAYRRPGAHADTKA